MKFKGSLIFYWSGSYLITEFIMDWYDAALGYSSHENTYDFAVYLIIANCLGKEWSFEYLETGHSEAVDVRFKILQRDTSSWT